MSVIRDLMRQSPIEVGTAAPPLSLTADEGTWVKLRDFEGHMNVVLVFFKTEDDATEAWLKALDAARPALEELDTAIYGVNTAPTDRLREFRAHLRGGFHFLYDPLALTARAFGMSRRALPMCRDGVVVVGKDQTVRFCEKGQVTVDAILKQLGQVEGRSANTAEAAPSAAATATDTVRKPGQAAPKVQDIDGPTAESMLSAKDTAYILVDVRTKSEYDADHSIHAKHVPVDELPHRYRDLGQGDHIVFVCQGGDRSAAAAAFMTSIGAHEIYNVLDGMSSWTGPRERTPVELQ